MLKMAETSKIIKPTSYNLKDLDTANVLRQKLRKYGLLYNTNILSHDRYLSNYDMNCDFIEMLQYVRNANIKPIVIDIVADKVINIISGCNVVLCHTGIKSTVDILQCNPNNLPEEKLLDCHLFHEKGNSILYVRGKTLKRINPYVNTIRCIGENFVIIGDLKLRPNTKTVFCSIFRTKGEHIEELIRGVIYVKENSVQQEMLVIKLTKSVHLFNGESITELNLKKAIDFRNYTYYIDGNGKERIVFSDNTEKYLTYNGDTYVSII